MISAVITLIIGYLIAKYGTDYIKSVFKHEKIRQVLSRIGYLEPIIDYIGYFIKLSIYVTTVLIAVSQLGFAQEVLTLVAVIILLSIIGVMIYSLRELIPCAISGAYLMRSKVISVGDRLSVKGFSGRIKEINLLTTTIKHGHRLVIIPNSIITKSILKKG